MNQPQVPPPSAGLAAGAARPPPAFPVVEAAGSARRMGRAHGEQAAPLVARYLEAIERWCGLDREALGRRARSFLPLLERFSAAYVEEVRGLAEGAGITFEQALVCQVRLEAGRAPEGCSAFALTGGATPNGRPLAGQNQDLEPEYDAFGIVLRLRPDDGRPRAVCFTFAGQLGYAGMNEHGVANFANALFNHRWRPGLPWYPVRRAFLEQASVAGCLAIARAWRTCSAANIVLCDGAGAIGDVEIRPEEAVEYRGPVADARLHTNHYVADRFRPFEDGTSPDSPGRLDRLTALVREGWGGWDVAGLARLLADHAGDPAGICRHGGGGTHSIAGYIAEPARGLLHVRRGHGCTGTWTAYEV